MTGDRSPAQWLAASAVDRPLEMLIDDADLGVRYSNADVLRAAQTWAAALRRIGIAHPDPVAVMLPATPEAYFAWLGIAWLRAIEVPINTDLRGSLLTHVLTSSGSHSIVVAQRYLGQLAEIAADLPDELVVIVIDAERVDASLPFKTITRGGFLDGLDPAADLTAPAGDDVASVVFTSGTTGPSKGVLVSWTQIGAYHAAFPNTLWGQEFRVYSPWPTFHINAKAVLFFAVERGGTIIVRGRFRTAQFWEDVRAHRATAATLFGGVSNFVWSAPEQVTDADNPLRHVLMAPVIPQYLEFEQRFGVQVHTGFASSEAGMPLSAHHPLPDHRTCGRVVPGYEVRLVDPDGSEVPPGATGEALVRADVRKWLCLGYLNLPEATAQAFADGWFHTGDAMSRDVDGNHYFVDRIKDCIRRRGENISSFEVENEVNAHPGVLESAAVGAVGGDGDEEVLIFVVASAHHEAPSPETLARFLIDRLPRFMVPRFVEFVDSLPKTDTGRTKKAELRARGVGRATWDRLAAGIEPPTRHTAISPPQKGQH